MPRFIRSTNPTQREHVETVGRLFKLVKLKLFNDCEVHTFSIFIFFNSTVFFRFLKNGLIKMTLLKLKFELDRSKVAE